MTINHISITKSRTVGGSSYDQRKVKFNKIVVTMEADLDEEKDNPQNSYVALSVEIDLALDYEEQKNQVKKESLKI